jgi:regulator of RNase E activity RraA
MRLASVILIAALGFAADVVPDQRLRANRNTYHPVMEVVKPQATPISDEQLEQLRRLPLEAVWGAVQRAGYTNSHVSGLQSSRPSEKLVGRAVTIRYLPRRPDLIKAMETLAKEGDWPVGWHVRQAEEVKPGDVLVVDLGGVVDNGVFWGDISALASKTAGAKGAILWGSSRDLTELRDIEGFPVYAVGFDPKPAVQIGVDWNVPIRVGGATVLPGDVVVGDEEAVLFFPASIAEQVIQQASRLVEQEEQERKLVREKQHRFRDVYPLSPELRKKWEAERKQRGNQ